MVFWVLLAVLIVLGLALAGVDTQDRRDRKRLLNRYWARKCTGREWRRRFPEAPQAEIRKFLDLFIDAFVFKNSQRFQFSPDDKPYQVYRALYPSLDGGDVFELETFAIELEKVYSVDLGKLANRNDITLGELFLMTRNPRQSLQAKGTSTPLPDLPAS